jgi:CheY-like chemotaxis protein
MVDFNALSLDQFEEYLRDCLPHLYDYAFLQENPLVHCLVPDATGASRVRAFRQIVKDSIEGLRPEMATTLDDKQARLYNILVLRYVDRQEAHDVMAQLALSERQFYREQPKAIQALARVLWERIAGTPPAETQPAVDGNLSVLSEVQRAYGDGNRTLVDLHSLLSGVIAAIQSLADQHSVHVRYELPAELPVVEANGIALRQAIIWTVTHLIIRSKVKTELKVECAVIHDECRITFSLNQYLQEGASLGAALEEQGTLKHLLNALAGWLSEEPDRLRLSLRIPLRQRLILIVDDNPDTISLFRRYLIGQPCHVLAAHDGKEAIELARQSQLSAIILDIMLPDQDGWEILQNLKNHPTTSHVPLMVCSVLNTPDLAYSLGADYYLKKPFSQTDLLNALAHLPG